MKFGDTLYDRSVPKWSAYNVNYNELKRLIKFRTSNASNGTAAPVSIPGQSSHKWADLEKDLFVVISNQYDNVALFLESKSGEVNRRLLHLERQVRVAQRSAAAGSQEGPILSSRRYHRLVSEAEEIGEDIQLLSRFAAVQKTAFRKILKKYRKWTQSTSLQARLEKELFSSGKLSPNYASSLERLSKQSRIITKELSGPLLEGRLRSRQTDESPSSATAKVKISTVKRLNEAAEKGPVHLDAALAIVPYGQAAGSAVYWIHLDNIEEAHTLLLRHMRDTKGTQCLSREDSAASISENRPHAWSNMPNANIVLYDNKERFVQDHSGESPSKAAVSARWCEDNHAAVTLAGLSPRKAEGQIISLKREDLARAFSRDFANTRRKTSSGSAATDQIQGYLLEHRDVKPLAHVHSSRLRFIGHNNSGEVGTWATLDMGVVFSDVDSAQVGATDTVTDQGEAFPHAVLEIRWEFARTPEVVRAFDHTHLVERVRDFSLEEAAVFTVHKELVQPHWRELLQKDIRKVPLTSRPSKAARRNRLKTPNFAAPGLSSGPSSTDGQADSIFSAARADGQSSATSEGSVSASAQDNALWDVSKPASPDLLKIKKRARISSDQQPPPQRYWNEFDDGDEGTAEEGYAIYVDPDASVFPGAETVSKAFSAMYESCSKGKNQVLSWLPMKEERSGKSTSERTPLLFGQGGSQPSEGDPESSDTDSEIPVPMPFKFPKHKRTISHASQRSASGMYRPHQPLTPRQKALERTYFSTYVVLLIVSFVLLIMSAILLESGRKKKVFEVDAGAIGGIVVAEACAIGAGVLICMRRQRLPLCHWVLVVTAIVAAVVLGIVQVAEVAVSAGAGQR